MFKYVIDKDVDLRLVDRIYADDAYKKVVENKEYLNEWLPWAKNNTLEDTKAFIEASMKQLADNLGFNAFIFYKDKICGTIGYHNLEWARNSVSIGYWLSEDCNGKGIMTKSCSKIVDYAFNGLNLNRVEIRCAVGNGKSRAIPTRLGFKEEGIVRAGQLLNGEYLDLVVYGMLRKDWDNRYSG